MKPRPADPKIERAIDKLLAKMSVEEKVGQTIQASITAVRPDDVKAYHLGSVLNGGGGWPGDVRKATPKDWLTLADAFYDASMDTTNGRLAIPVMWGADAVHGHNNIVGATLFPHNVGLGATRDFDLIRRIGEATAAEMAATGIDWNFSPTVAVARDRRWGRSYESYSEDPALVRRYAASMVIGLQGRPGTKAFLAPGTVIATSKHFIGDGGTNGGVDQGDTLASEDELRDIHAAGYAGALEAGVQAVMASYNSWHGRKLHGYKPLLDDVLKQRMGFDGIVVGDWNGHGQVPGCTNRSCPQSLNAGLDMFMVPEDWKALYENTLAQVRSGEIPMARLDDAVRRILRVKMRAGLFTAGKPSRRRFGGDFAQIGSPAHRRVARQAVRESLVLLKNNGRLLPLRRNMNVLVAGDGAHNIAKQCGGWTLTWQGDGNSNADFPGATSIWSGIRIAVESAGGRARLSPDGSFTDKPDVAIVVFGENSYAEFQGDRKTLVYEDVASLQMLQRLKAAGVPVVSIFLSGRPLWVNPFLNASDAFVAAWLPGTEGGGVADVLFAAADGRPRYDFHGTLGFSWPKTPAQVVINKGDADYDPLYPLGFGLTYADRRDLPQLPASVEGLAQARPNRFFAGSALAPWRLCLRDDSIRIVTDPNSITSAGGVMTMVTVPRGAQESGRSVTWSGERRGEVFLSADAPLDLTRESNGNLAVAFAAAVMKAPTRPVLLGVGNTEIDIGPMLRAQPSGEWRTVRMRLRCFADRGADLAHVAVPFRIATDGELGLSFADVELVPVTDAEAPCPAR